MNIFFCNSFPKIFNNFFRIKILWNCAIKFYLIISKLIYTGCKQRKKNNNNNISIINKDSKLFLVRETIPAVVALCELIK